MQANVRKWNFYVHSRATCVFYFHRVTRWIWRLHSHRSLSEPGWTNNWKFDQKSCENFYQDFLRALLMCMNDAVFDWQIWRALRLIVDPGLHYKGMTRSQALRLHSEKAWDDTDVAEKEVTRYQSVVGQATGYMIGQLYIKKARESAKRELGSEFNLKDFHYQVLSQGALPLGYLSDHIRRYIVCKKNPEQSGCNEILKPQKESEVTSSSNKATSSSKMTSSIDRVLSEKADRPILYPHDRHYI